MGLAVGIVGLPNVGKSTTFNALTKASNAESANYPFCTIEPNKAIVPVPDKRLNELAKIVNPNKIQHSTIEFVDIAGLVKGASKGEGLGNKFLSNIRETEVILHMVRCFDDSNVTHVENSVDPIRDIGIIEMELILADIEQLSKKIDKLTKEVKANAKGAKEMLECANTLLEHLNNGNSASSFDEFDSDIFQNLNKELRLLSAKEVIYGANVSEDFISEDNEYVKQVRDYAARSNHEVIKLCAKIEEELIGLDDSEAAEMLESLGACESGLESIIKTAFSKLNLISYFTAGVVEVRAWTIHKGWKAPKAASVIHNDFERGFIRAEVISYDDFIASGGETKAKEAGKMRLEGKDYVVNDGDVMHFRFNV
ncbi:redox-regulated ATPase YchF [Campylobacter fetus]|uniref:Ribosome-binding ATPase YchF n=1 Tax=Campylobacter fetus subsp. testudinum TaxID=1507806 RepID=A0AAX0HDG3_CAMFE|nr:redox-regulated ATPase YchF [Campylobacter fetus]ALV65169.1 GTP-binding protein, putative GTP-dependent translation factor [Campylobacter fetus subsp. testudinum Sp3]EAK0829670.1 redox-regulated ATPase YchF [Campylobacter fetus]OCR88808.1 GTP-binding protein [Campylobacter fetus subsp. testudinum]OCR91645.1 GTP-binding protein [Campylobacter fetus subsp. testudinum]OCR95912.1 GTP-binding protein [Campylobacter fetus subsp. testudinum]